MEFNKLDLVTTLNAKKKKILSNSNTPSVLVGYQAAYALAVHEDVEMKLRGVARPSGIGQYWGPQGEAKFLEKPARINQSKYVSIIRDALKRGLTMEEALKLAALELQRDSQEIVPVEYGNLRASSFVEVEKGAM